MTRIIGSGDDAVKEFTRKCLELGGIPTYVVEYGGMPLRYRGKPAVIVRCYPYGEILQGGIITDVSEELWSKIVEYRKDAEKLAKEWGIPVPTRE